jgi:hypothetical protein
MSLTNCTQKNTFSVCSFFRLAVCTVVASQFMPNAHNRAERPWRNSEKRFRRHFVAHNRRNHPQSPNQPGNIIVATGRRSTKPCWAISGPAGT